MAWPSAAPPCWRSVSMPAPDFVGLGAGASGTHPTRAGHPRPDGTHPMSCDKALARFLCSCHRLCRTLTPSHRFPISQPDPMLWRCSHALSGPAFARHEASPSKASRSKVISPFRASASTCPRAFFLSTMPQRHQTRISQARPSQTGLSQVKPNGAWSSRTEPGRARPGIARPVFWPTTVTTLPGSSTSSIGCCIRGLMWVRHC